MRKTLGKIEDVICAVALVFMTVLTFANVAARYVFSASFSFSKEITTYLFVLLSLIGSAAAIHKAHFGIYCNSGFALVRNKKSHCDLQLPFGIFIQCRAFLVRYGTISNSARARLLRVCSARVDIRSICHFRCIFYSDRIFVLAD